MLDYARAEADGIVAKAEADATAAISRREKMASDKIAAAERAAGIERAGRSGRTEAAAGPVLQPLQPKTDGNRPLDVFA